MSARLVPAKLHTKDVDATLRITICHNPAGATWAQISDAIRSRFIVGNWVTEVRNRIQYLMDTGALRRKPGSGITGPEAYEGVAARSASIL